MKLRIIIWTVVGILVVAGIIFLIFGGKNPRQRVTLKELKWQTERTEKSINELFGQLAQAKAIPLPGTAAQSLNTAESLLNQSRTIIEQTKKDNDLKTIEQNLRTVHRLLTKTRRIIREATRPQPAKPAGV
jgi:tRNA/tmRNA/rRNA uracil-C5-methylase (TrmA/RlmC/RlmD family)